MQKQIVAHPSAPPNTAAVAWTDLKSAARVRLTSEDPAFPIEAALQDGAEGQWKAAQPGSQTIWIDFDVPQAVHEIKLRFEATERRTQEFLLSWSSDGGASYQEIVRQQFNFSPERAQAEDETYHPRLSGVTGLQLTIVPDISGGDARASLRALRIR